MVKKILIIVDSSSTISKQTALENEIEILPLSIYRNDNKSYIYEGMEIKPEELLQMSESGFKFSTGCTPLGIVENVIDEKLKSYDVIIALPISQKWSSQYSHLKSLSEQAEYKNKLYVIDTLDWGYSIECLALELRKMIVQDVYSIDDLIKFATNWHKKSVSFFFCKSLDGLVSSGRVPSIIGKLMKFAKIYPIIKVDEENHLEAIIKNLAEIVNKMIKSTFKVYGGQLKPDEIEHIAILTACNNELEVQQTKIDVAKAFNINPELILIKPAPNIFVNIVSRDALGITIVAKKNKE